MASEDPETWMWERARSLLEQADRGQRQFFQLGGADAGPVDWEPPVDVFETARQLWILVALPGVSPKRIEILLEGNELVVGGERSLPKAFRKAEVHRLEIPRGRFVRRLSLPPGRYEIGMRDMLDGCLVLNLKKLP